MTTNRTQAEVELVAAVYELLHNGPCSDPDCCATAKKEAAARERLRIAIQDYEDSIVH